MEENEDKLLKSIMDSFDKNDYVRLSDIPNIELYMDQVTTFMDTRLRNNSRNPSEDKIMTKTMINNYAKNDLLPPPVKKKYSREHIIVLLFIYYFKSFLSINDIQTLLNPLTEKFFGTQDEYSFKDIYDEVIKLEKAQVEDIKEDVLRQYRLSDKSFENAPEDSREFLKTFSLICAMSYDLYLKQSIIEKLIDELRDDKKK